MSTTTSNLGLFKYNTSTDAQVAFNIDTALNNNWDILDKSLIKGDIISLGSSGTQTLTANRIHKCTATSSITFSVPTGSSTEFKQMVILFYMGSSYSVSLGASRYLGGTAPSMTTGYYTIIYEYDPIYGSWAVGALKKS